MSGWLLAFVVVVAAWVLVVLGLIVMGRRAAARELASLVPNLLRLFHGLLRDPRVPRRSKAWIWFAVAWLASPIDLIPEFIPIAGSLDDAIVAALVLRYVMRRTEPTVLADHWRGDSATLATISRNYGVRRRPQLTNDQTTLDQTSAGDRRGRRQRRPRPGRSSSA